MLDVEFSSAIVIQARYRKLQRNVEDLVTVWNALLAMPLEYIH